MNELSQRLQRAMEFLVENSFAKSDAAIAKKLGVAPPVLNMSKRGARVPTWDLLLKFSDAYPISFDWLRTGTGDMIKEDKTTGLLRRIAELENEIKELKSSLK